MGILRDFEKRLEGAVEGFFARAFRSGLQPVELAKAIQRYAADYKQVGIEGVYVPNVYRIILNPQDMDRFSGFAESLQRELASVARRTAQERGWRLQGPIRIELHAAERIRVGTYELRGKLEAAQDEPAPRRALPSTEPASADRTIVMPAAGGPRAALRIDNGPQSGRRITVAESTVVGRLPECDVTLEDPSVSRRHVRISRDNGQWTIEDLGSTNGLRVNDRTVGRARLNDGDRLELGSVKLSFNVEG